MKKITIIISLLFIFLSTPGAFANERETDFAPFPLSISSEGLLNGFWESDGGYLEIAESENYSINGHRWFIIYEVEDEYSSDKVVVGFIYYEVDSDEYKRVEWINGGVDTSSFVLYSMEERAATSDSDDMSCLNRNVFMLKLNEVVYVRTECED